MIKRVSTGIRELDKLISGGFKEKSNNLIVGGPGSGKTIFALQFLMEGIMNNEPGMYVTFEEKKEKLYEDMSTFGWDLAEHEKKGRFVFLEYTPEQVKKVVVEGGGTIESMITKMKTRRIVIDSITSFSLLYKEELTKKEALLALFELINNWGCTSVLTSQTEILGLGTPLVQFEVDTLIYLYHLKMMGIRERGFEILKMRGTNHPCKTFRMNITPKGIKIFPNKLCSFEIEEKRQIIL